MSNDFFNIFFVSIICPVLYKFKVLYGHNLPLADEKVLKAF